MNTDTKSPLAPLFSSLLPLGIGVIALLVFFITLSLATENFSQSLSLVAYNRASPYYLTLAGSFVIGSVGFVLAVVNYAALRSVQGSKGVMSIVRRLVKFLLILLLFPLDLLLLLLAPLSITRFLISKVTNAANQKAVPWKEVAVRILFLLFTCFVFLPLWLLSCTTLAVVVQTAAKNALGYTEVVYSIPGTGSMYPTFPKSDKKDPKEMVKEIVGEYKAVPYPNGLVLLGKRYLGHELGRGDIVIFQNEKTEELNKKVYGDPGGLVKRLIALPGDQVELRDGIVYLNNTPLKEPYTAKPRSSFGESFLAECKALTVPSGSVFVMGDNRKGSADSREIGFVPIKDISHVISYSSQKGILDKNYRDTSSDLKAESRIKFDAAVYLSLLNKKRLEAKLTPLRYQPKLEQSATLRGKAMIKSNDFSWEATRSGVTMESAIKQVGYTNIVYGENYSSGYFEAEELIDNQFAFPESKKFLLNPEYQEMGIVAVQGEINGCPTQVIVQQLAGYVPPNYEQKTIDSWKTHLEKLKQIRPSWEQARSFGAQYENNKQDFERIIAIINQRIAQTNAIVAKMEANQWLSEEEKAFINDDAKLGEEQEALAKKLNQK